MRIEMERQNALMIEIAAKLPDDQAKVYAKYFPSMRMDVAEFAPNVHPQFWEEL